MSESTPPSPAPSRLRRAGRAVRFSRARLFRLVLLGAVSALVLTTCTPATLVTQGGGLSETLSNAVSQEDEDANDGDGQDGLRPQSESARPAATKDKQGSVPRQGSAERAESVEEAQLDWPEIDSAMPQLRIDGVPDERNLVGELHTLEGVDYAASVRIGEVAVAVGPADVQAVNVASVNPERFRHLTPQATADAMEVWQRIVEGDAAFVHDVGNRLQLELGERLPAAGTTTLRVGALASNGAPPIADAIVNRDTGVELGIDSAKTVFVVGSKNVSPSQLAARVREAVGLEVELLEKPEPQKAMLSGAAARGAFEPFNYISLGDGMLQIERGWVSRNIVTADVPVFPGTVRCHRLMIPQLRGALQEIQAEGLAKHIRANEYGGCFTPRHVMFDANRGISMHAWGLAVDFNVARNGYGQQPQMHPRIVEIFRKWGFNWGGAWSTPDGMHFELGALMEGPQ